MDRRRPPTHSRLAMTAVDWWSGPKVYSIDSAIKAVKTVSTTNDNCDN